MKKPARKTDPPKITQPLDEFQLGFARDKRRALRVLAPAGSGKTHSLLWRCVKQWESAEKPKPRFLLFTFTRAARDELKDRLRTRPEFAAVGGCVEVSTLNSWGFRWLKRKTHALKLLTSRKDLVFAVFNELQPAWMKHPKLRELLTDGSSRNPVAKAVMTVMDGLKSLGFRHDVHHKAPEYEKHVKWLKKVGLTTYLDGLVHLLSELEIIDKSSQEPMKEMERGFLRFWRDATKSLRGMAKITLEDQKYWAWIELEKALAKGEFRTGVHRCDHIMVDEFQDVNCLDLRLLQTIAKINKAELTLIGDDDQAIFEWRGASPEFILEPDKYVGRGFATHILERNYRSPRNIVHLSQKLIKHNIRRVPKNVKAMSKDDARIDVLGMHSLSDSIDYVVKEVRRMLNDDEIKTVAIISRKRCQIIPYQIVFASENIPFYAAEDLQVFLSDAFKELKEILALKARAGTGPIPGISPIDDLMNLVKKVKRYPLKKNDAAGLLKHIQSKNPKSLLECVASLRSYTGPLKGNNEDASRSKAFADAIQALIKTDSVSAAINAISLHFEGFQNDYAKSAEDIFYSDPPFSHLAEFAERYKKDYSAFFSDLDKAIATLARVPNEDNEAAQEETPDWKLRLHLMTALRAKGKEFDAVLILDANQDIWPSKLARTEAELEQERRVFYVAFTRARKRLTLLVNHSILGEPAIQSPYIAEMGLAVKQH